MQTAMSAAISTALGAVFLCLAATPVSARQSLACGKHDEVVRRLGKLHDERVTASAFDVAGNFVEILVSGTGTWTILLSLPGGPSCIVAAGTGWQEAGPPVAESDS